MRYIRNLILFYFLLHSSVRADNGQRAGIIRVAESQCGITELTGHNDGRQVEEFLTFVGLKKGDPWCSAVLCWIFNQFGASNPCSGLAASWFRKGKIVYDRRYPTKAKLVRQADLGGINFDDPPGIHHVMIIDVWGSQWVDTYEGNTSDANEGKTTYEGQGFFHKRRLKKQIFQVASWID